MGSSRPAYDGRTRIRLSNSDVRRLSFSDVWPAEHRGRMGAGTEGIMNFILWIIAVILVVWGIVSIFRSRLLMGIVLIIVGLLVGPGGVSLFS